MVSFCKRQWQLLELPAETVLNCWACTWHWMKASHEANEYCSSPFLEHSTQLSKGSIPNRFYHLFDRLTPQIIGQGYAGVINALR